MPSTLLPGSAERRAFVVLLAAMAGVVLASNVLVQFPLPGVEAYLTLGAFTYPFAFLVSDLSNRRFGPAGARRIVYGGFVVAVVLSALLATPRIAVASGAAFLLAQLLDIAIFARLRDRAWWVPPFVSSVIASALDTAVFFSLAFYCGPLPGTSRTIVDVLAAFGLAEGCLALPWPTLAAADYGVKVALAALSLAPYGVVLRRLPKPRAA